MTVKIVAFVSVKPGEDDAFVAAARICVAASRAEPGTPRYDLWREDGGARRFVFDELHADGAAVRQHMASDHFKVFGLAARGSRERAARDHRDARGRRRRMTSARR